MVAAEYQSFALAPRRLQRCDSARAETGFNSATVALPKVSSKGCAVWGAFSKMRQL